MIRTGCEIHIERGRIRAILPREHGVCIRTERDTFDFPQAWVMPGFVDAHVHLHGLGKKLTVTSLHDLDSEDACIEALKHAPVDSHGWIHAMGWNQESWSTRQLPTSRSLTDALPTTPVVCSRIDGHALWVNKEALRCAGISHPTGVLVDEEMDAMWSALPEASRSDIENQLIVASQAFAKAGVTEVHDMDVAPKLVPIVRELAEQAKLAVRVQSFVSAQHNEWSTSGLLPAGGELQRTAGVKMYADGALGSRGAALLEPYADAASRGTSFLSSHRIAEQTLLAVHAGWWCVAVHAIGDAAVRSVLDAFQAVREHPDGSEVILRIEHAQHIHPADLPRFAELNVIASIQPTHALSDATMAAHRLGDHRLSHAYRWRSLRESGASLCSGTDAPIESESALRTLQVATHGIPGQPQRNQRECLSFADAVAAATNWAHVAAGMDYRRGTLSVGMDADLVILSNNPEHATNMTETRVLATFTAGMIHAV